ncbi:MAG TPA: asparagine synthase-related protein, partial [Desulfuromonadaceae bacterium]
MSAIWGLWIRDGRGVTREEIERMGDSLSVYGAERGFWNEGETGLGVALSPVLPEDAHDRQPLRSREGRGILVSDLRLDNRAELCADLGIGPATAAGMADSEILLAAWDRWGETCPERLIGEFAFAVWEPAARKLFCARDHFGLRALHYFVQGPLFAFSTFPKGIIALPGVPCRVDESMIALRLALFPETGSRSFFKDIPRLPPGHALTVTPDAISVRRYYKLDTERRITLPGDDAYVDRFREILDEAVRCRLRSTGPVGAMLSGGFDSGTVAATAAKLLAAEGRPLTAFTGAPAPGFDGLVYSAARFGDEGGHAAAVAAMYRNMTHVLVHPEDVCPLDLQTRLMRLGDTPGGHLSMAPSAHAMARAHRKHGVATVLTAGNGNLTISYTGMPLLPSLIRQGRYLRWLVEAGGVVKEGGGRGVLGVLKGSFGPFLPKPLWRLAAGTSKLSFARPGDYSMLHPRLLASGEIRALAEETGWDPASRPKGDGRRLRAAAVARVDAGGSAAAGMAAAGVDYRDPTMDKRLVEFCLAIPEEQYLRNGTA